MTGRGIEIGQTSVAKYMARRRGPPSQGWKTFLRNHAEGIAVMDLFVVPIPLLTDLRCSARAIGRTRLVEIRQARSP